MVDRKEDNKIGEVRTGRTGDRPYWVLIFSIFIRIRNEKIKKDVDMNIL